MQLAFLTSFPKLIPRIADSGRSWTRIGPLRIELGRSHLKGQLCSFELAKAFVDPGAYRWVAGIRGIPGDTEKPGELKRLFIPLAASCSVSFHYFASVGCPFIPRDVTPCFGPGKRRAARVCRAVKSFARRTPRSANLIVRAGIKRCLLLNFPFRLIGFAFLFL